MSNFKIVGFYNKGARVQVVVPGRGVDMRRSFTAKRVPDSVIEIGYKPRPNSKLASGPSYDELEHEGDRYLLLKGGHTYAVRVGDSDHVISAEDGHIALPLPRDVDVDVDEYDEEKHGAPEQDDGYTDEQVIAAAEAAHEANREYCASIGDDTQVAWADAEEWQRESAVAGVWGVIDGNTPEQSHEGWMALKEAEGWVYGEVKDAEAKTHPAMLPYADLPDEQKAKDDIFVATVKASLGIADDEED